MDLKSMGFLEIDHDLFKKTNTPYKIYAEFLDETSQKQFFDVLNEPYVTYGALMPDAHAGYSMPIGAICSTKDVVVPQFVGFDIGCGMCAYKTNYYKDDILKNAKEIYQKIITEIPLGFKKHKNHQSFKCNLPRTQFADYVLNSLALMQLGTLGGGNHFIEIGYDNSDRVWIIIHSGSRGFGHKIATYYMIEAYKSKNLPKKILEKILNDFTNRNQNLKKHNPERFKKSLEKFKNKKILELNKKINLDRLDGIWGLKVDSKLGQDYIKDQNLALEFALENRKKMIEVICKILDKTIKGDFGFEFEDEDKFINKNHNHVEFDESLNEWIHRKGATHANKDMMGVIPGNMRDGSFIVRGKGCKESLYSSSHGAGRVMSRVKAKQSISMNQFKESMKGITATIDKNTIDESPFAYKDIFLVMEQQKELVEVIEHIKVLINIKDNSKNRY